MFGLGQKSTSETFNFRWRRFFDKILVFDKNRAA